MGRRKRGRAGWERGQGRWRGIGGGRRGGQSFVTKRTRQLVTEEEKEDDFIDKT